MNNPVAFTKMHALGNDFIVIDGLSQSVSLGRRDIIRMSDRHTGIGFDQLLLLEATDVAKKNTFKYRIFNANGQEVGQCGNGARCIAQFIKRKGWVVGGTVKLEALDRTMEVNYLEDNFFAVNMGHVNFSPRNIPMSVLKEQRVYSLKVNENVYPFVALSLGNPHAIFFDKPDVRVICRQLEEDRLFLKGVNVGFVQVLSRNKLKLRVIERGVGETYACGSGACAAVIAGNVLNLLNNEVIVQMKGGELTVKYKDKAQPVWLIGPCEMIYEGVYKKS